MIAQPLLFLLAASWCFLKVPAQSINVTVDDTFGNAYGAGFIYSDGWALSSQCATEICPSVEMAYDYSYHTTAQYETSDLSTNASLSFNGTALYVYCIVAQNQTTALSFILDDNYFSEFQMPATTSSTVMYDVPVFVSGPMLSGPHTFTVVNGGTAGNSIAILDYAIYTTEADLSATVSSSIVPEATVTEWQTLYDMDAQTRTIIISVTTVGGTILIALAVLACYWRRHPYKGYDASSLKRARVKRSTSAVRGLLLPPDRGALTPSKISTAVSMQSSVYANEPLAIASAEDGRPVASVSPLPVVASPPLKPEGPKLEGNSSSPAMLRYGPHVAAPNLVLTIPKRMSSDVVVEDSTNASSSDPPSVPPKWTPAMQQRTTPDPFRWPPPISNKGRRPRSEGPPKTSGSSFPPPPPPAKRQSGATSAATPGTGTRASGMYASDRTNPSTLPTPTSDLRMDFVMNNSSTPDLPARADSVKTVSTMAMSGRHLNRLTGHVLPVTPPLPATPNMPLQVPMGKSTDSATPSLGSRTFDSFSPSSNTDYSAPQAAIDALEVDGTSSPQSPIPVVDSPDALSPVDNLRVLAMTPMLREPAYSDSPVLPSAPGTLRRHSIVVHEAPRTPPPSSAPDAPHIDAVRAAVVLTQADVSKLESHSLPASPSGPLLRHTEPSTVARRSVNVEVTRREAEEDQTAVPLNSGDTGHLPDLAALPVDESAHNKEPLSSLQPEIRRRLPPIPPSCNRLPGQAEGEHANSDVAGPRPQPFIAEASRLHPVNPQATVPAMGGSRAGPSIRALPNLPVNRDELPPSESVAAILTPSVATPADALDKLPSSETSSASRLAAVSRPDSPSSASTVPLTAPNRHPDMNIPKLWATPSERISQSSSAGLTESVRSVRALPLIPNRYPGVVLGTTLTVSESASMLSAPSRENSVKATNRNAQSLNHYPAVACPLGARTALNNNDSPVLQRPRPLLDGSGNSD